MYEPIHANPQEEPSFECPACGAENSLLIDLSGGTQQSFVTDCEVCCRPLNLHIHVHPDGTVEINADRE